MKKSYRIIAAALFLAALFITPALLLFSSDRDFSENENRYLAQRPELSLEAVLSGRFMKDTEKYIDDQFPARDFFTSAGAGLLRLAGSREINGVYLGEDGYLIEKWAERDFRQERLERNLAAVEAFAARHPEGETTLMLVPTAGLILQDRLPENAPMFDQNKAFELAAEAVSQAALIDLRETLAAHRDEEIFYRTDHHWTSRGAFLAWADWAERKGFSAREEDYETETVTEDFRGSLYSKVLSRDCARDSIELYSRKGQSGCTVYYNFGKSRSDSVYAEEKLEKKDKYQVFLGGNHPELSIETGAAGGRLLLIKDSFANAFIPFLLNDYESIHVIDPRYFNGDIEGYIAAKGITEFLFLYNMKNFCEDNELEALLAEG